MTAQDSVIALEHARGQALLERDTITLSAMVAIEFLEISRVGQLRTRAENLQEIETGRLRLATVRYDSLQVRIYGDIAVLTGIANNTGAYGSVPFSGKIRYMRVFVRRDGRWQAIAMQQTSTS